MSPIMTLLEGLFNPELENISTRPLEIDIIEYIKIPEYVILNYIIIR